MSSLLLDLIIKAAISVLAGVAVGLYLGDDSLAVTVAIVIATAALLSYQLDSHFKRLYDAIDDEECDGCDSPDCENGE